MVRLNFEKVIQLLHL